MTFQILQIAMDAVICALLILCIENNREAHDFLTLLVAAGTGSIDARIVKHEDDDGFDIVSTKEEEDHAEAE